jgi:AcrR family transcriptional regulator
LSDVDQKKNNASSDDVATDPVGRREAGKRERRRRIIDAAREMIRETGNAGLSMRALAVRAGVSLATPYNLFGSRHAIVLAVLGDVREYQERFAALRSADPIERIFVAADLALEYYKADSKFYKTLWGAVFASDEVHSDILNPNRDAFWIELIGEAIAAGALSKLFSAVVIQKQLDFVLRAAMHGWVVGDIDEERLTPTVFCGFALILRGAAMPAWRGTLQVRLLDSQAKMLDEGDVAPLVELGDFRTDRTG